jgi:hypothetical protein
MKKLFALLVIFALFFAGCDHDGDYSVTYHSNGTPNGFAPTDPKKYKYDEEAVVLGKHTLQNPDFTSFYWNTKSDGSGDRHNEGDRIRIKGAVFLYAIWE